MGVELGTIFFLSHFLFFFHPGGAGDIVKAARNTDYYPIFTPVPGVIKAVFVHYTVLSVHTREGVNNYKVVPPLQLLPLRTEADVSCVKGLCPCKMATQMGGLARLRGLNFISRNDNSREGDTALMWVRGSNCRELSTHFFAPA